MTARNPLDFYVVLRICASEDLLEELCRFASSIDAGADWHINRRGRLVASIASGVGDWVDFLTSAKERLVKIEPLLAMASRYGCETTLDFAVTLQEGSRASGISTTILGFDTALMELLVQNRVFLELTIYS